MGKQTQISWADATWPVTVGCDKVSAGCSNCYAMKDARRMGSNPNPKVSAVYNGLVEVQTNGLLNWTGMVRELPERLDWPSKWPEHRDIFVCSQSDLFHEDISDEFIGRAFSAMWNYSWHTFYVLTKRPERLVKLLQETPPDGLQDFNSTNFPHVMIGISAENQKAAEERMPYLLQMPLDPTQRFVSAEPLIGSLDVSQWRHGFGWLIGGGESGLHAKPMHPAWPRLLRDQCDEAEILFHFKQWGEWSPFPPSPDPEVKKLDGGGTLYQMKPLIAKTKLPLTTTIDGMTMYRVGRRQAGHVLDGVYWNARPGHDNTDPMYAVHPLGTSVCIDECAGPRCARLHGVITTIRSLDEAQVIELDGEEVDYYLTVNGQELEQAFGYWQLVPTGSDLSHDGYPREPQVAIQLLTGEMVHLDVIHIVDLQDGSRVGDIDYLTRRRAVALLANAEMWIEQQ